MADLETVRKYMDKSGLFGIEHTEVVDIICPQTTTDRALLVMIADHPWGKDGLTWQQLMKKTFTYVIYAMGGGIEDRVPELGGKTAKIILLTKYPLGEFEREIVKVMYETFLKPLDIEWEETLQDELENMPLLVDPPRLVHPGGRA